MAGRRQAVEIVFDKATKRYPGRAAAAVDELSLTIPSGEICCLVGPSGGGKTTAMKLVSRTIGVDRVVDEMVFSFEHTQEIPWMLPDVPPTGKKVSVALVAIVCIR